jgi:hypothetical protein
VRVGLESSLEPHPSIRPPLCPETIRSLTKLHPELIEGQISGLLRMLFLLPYYSAPLQRADITVDKSVEVNYTQGSQFQGIFTINLHEEEFCI